MTFPLILLGFALLAPPAALTPPPDADPSAVTALAEFPAVPSEPGQDSLPPSSILEVNPLNRRLEPLEQAFAHLEPRLLSYWNLARIELSLGQFRQAEQHLIRFLALTADEKARFHAMLHFIQAYNQAGLRVKLIHFLENYCNRYTGDPFLPLLFLELGRIHADLGNYERARDHYYKIIHLSLHFPIEQQKDYREISRRAHWEIAQSYLLAGDYPNAIRFFVRLSRTDMPAEDYLRAVVKIAECHFALNDYQAVISTLEAVNLPENRSVLPPNAHYLLSRAYLELNQRSRAMDEVIYLLGKVSETRDQDSAFWLHWKDVTGRQMANAFYGEADYFNALQIYQAMAPLKSEPAWLLPIVYRIGLCFEHLDMPFKAEEAYQFILSHSEPTPSEAASPSAVLEPGMDTVGLYREAAQWRKAHLAWDASTQRQIVRLEQDTTGNPLPSDTHE